VLALDVADYLVSDCTDRRRFSRASRINSPVKVYGIPEMPASLSRCSMRLRTSVSNSGVSIQLYCGIKVKANEVYRQLGVPKTCN
jgi:hypothetical protein